MVILVTTWESEIDILPFTYLIIIGKVLQKTLFSFVLIIIIF